MEFGYIVPTRGPFGNRESALAIARHADALGFGYVACTDHIVVPRAIDSNYPYTETGQFPGSASGEYMEPLTLLACLAGATETVRLLTSVMVVPHRPAVLTAKMLATIDVLSGGRVTLGCGAGWMREEFDAIDAPPFDQRGAVTDEYIAAFRKLWTEDDPHFDGEFVAFSDIIFLPKPIQKPIPVWTGGESGRALRRAARIADGWYPVGNNPSHPLNTLTLYSAKLDEFRDLAEGYGRDPTAIVQAYWAMWYQADQTLITEGGARVLMTGSIDQVHDDIGQLSELGVKVIMLGYAAPSLPEMLDNMSRFAEEIASKV